MKTLLLLGMLVIIREMPVAWIAGFCNHCVQPRGICSGCATGGVLGRAPGGASRKRCIIYLRNDISGWWKSWVIQHELGHCEHGYYWGH